MAAVTFRKLDFSSKSSQSQSTPLTTPKPQPIPSAQTAVDSAGSFFPPAPHVRKKRTDLSFLQTGGHSPPESSSPLSFPSSNPRPNPSPSVSHAFKPEASDLDRKAPDSVDVTPYTPAKPKIERQLLAQDNPFAIALSNAKKGFANYQKQSFAVRPLTISHLFTETGAAGRSTSKAVKGTMAEIFIIIDPKQIVDGTDNGAFLVKYLQAVNCRYGLVYWTTFCKQRSYVMERGLKVVVIVNEKTWHLDGFLLVRKVPHQILPQNYWGGDKRELTFDKLSLDGQKILGQLRKYFDLAFHSLKDGQILDIQPKNFKLDSEGDLTLLDFQEMGLDSEEIPEQEHFSALLRDLSYWSCGNTHVRDYLLGNLRSTNAALAEALLKASW